MIKLESYFKECELDFQYEQNTEWWEREEEHSR